MFLDALCFMTSVDTLMEINVVEGNLQKTGERGYKRTRKLTRELGTD